MLNNISLKWKGILIILFCLLGMGTLEYLSALQTKDTMLEEKKIKIQEIVKTLLDVVTQAANLAKTGAITEDEAKERAKAAIRSIVYNQNNDYVFVYDFDGTCLVTGVKPEMEGKNILGAKDSNGMPFVAQIIEVAKGEGGFVNYMWDRKGINTPKISYAMGYKPWNWLIGTGIYIDDVENAFYSNLEKALMNLSIVIIIVGGFTIVVVRSIINPILLTSEQMKKITKKENVEITGTDRQDELGAMSRTLLEMKDSIDKQNRMEAELSLVESRKREENRITMNNLANSLENQVGTIVVSIEKAIADLQTMSTTLASASEETTRQSNSVASASQLASANVQTVAAASEELSASIKELVRNISDTAAATKVCTETAKVSQSYLKVLQTSVDEIDGVIQAINGVASQTNLLALNATIEAARAGEAGKGFAVVANEVKNLAGATNKMTEEIAKKINDIKTSSSDTIKSMQDIMKQIAAVDERTTSISTAVEEQNASTLEISRSAQEASSCTNEVFNSIGQVQIASKDTALSTDQLKQASEDLASQASYLKMAIATFIKEVRTT